MAQNIEIVDLKKLGRSATVSGKLRLLGFYDLEDSVSRQDCEHWTKPESFGLIPMRYEEAVMWTTFVKGEEFGMGVINSGFRHFYVPIIPEQILDLLETLLKAGTFADYRILTMNMLIDNRQRICEAMLVAIDWETASVTYKKLLFEPLSVILGRYKNIRPSVYRLARWCGNDDCLMSEQSANRLLCNRILNGMAEYMTRDLRQNALQACEILKG